jgi:hypothetical protein
MRLATIMPSRRSWARPLMAVMALVAVVGCDCKGVQLKGHAAKISVNPNPIDISDGVVGQTKEIDLQVSNIGTNTLTVTKTPYIVEQSGDAVAFAVINVFVRDCMGGPRDPSKLNTFAVAECARVTLRYQPKNDGKVTAKLRFESNDPNTPLDVPIVVDSLTPHIKACAFDGMTMLNCSSDGMPLNLNFDGTPTGIGSTAVRTVKLISFGTKTVSVPDMTLAGDPDFSVTPGPGVFKGVTIDPGKDSSFDVTFAPVAGGPRSGTLTFLNVSDPKNVPLVVNISAQADGPALCFCVGSATEACRPTPKADFGSVAVGASGSKFLRLASCGTQPLILQSVGVANVGGSTAFALPTSPAANTTIAAGMTLPDIPITFTPPTPDPFTGKLIIKTANGSPFIDLTGQGIEGGCKIQVSSNTLDFGQVLKGVTASRDYVIANVGSDSCAFPKPPVITVGANVSFVLGGYPLQALAPTRTAKITVTYTPADLVGPDAGTMEVYYAGPAAGAATTTLVVNLKGEPVATPVCRLAALPAANSAFGASLNFGQVGLNRPKVLPIVFQNVGSANCSLGKASVVPPLLPIGPEGAFTIKTQPQGNLAPGATTTIQVQFLPTAETSYGSPFGMLGIGAPGLGDSVQIPTSDTVTFNGSACGGGFGPAGAPGCAAWSLSGEGVTSTIQVLPDNVDFGEVTLGCRSLEKKISIYNVGQSDIHITGFKVDPMPPPSIFVVLAPTVTATAPYTIHAGGKLDISVRYHPSMVGIETGTLYIESDAVPGGTSSSSSNPYVTVSLIGTGTTDSSQTDVFQQLDHPVADVLWVIDMDSNSMADKQQAIANNSKAFINAAIAANTDFHLGVVSGYVGMNEKSNNSGITIKPGELYNVHAPQAWVQSSDANPSGEFAENANIGVTADATGAETGLEAMFRALSDPIINKANKGFLRPDARLIVISISDDDDLSSKSTDFYSAFLQSLKPNSPQDVIFDTVGGDQPNGCTNGVDGDPAQRYWAVSQTTGGKDYSICNGQYDQIAADLSIGSFGGRTHFVLSRPCDPTTLTVTVGSSMERMGTDFTFDANRNAIDFTTAPASGSTITASYNALCL